MESILYCTNMTNPSIEVTKSGDKHLAAPVVTGDCWVWLWVSVVFMVTGKSASNSCGD